MLLNFDWKLCKENRFWNNECYYLTKQLSSVQNCGRDDNILSCPTITSNIISVSSPEGKSSASACRSGCSTP